MHALVLAFLSGAPALAYQVVWTREVALLAGGQLDAIATVVAAFFGGLALGAALLGALGDRSAHPLRLYGTLEIAAGVLALLATLGLRALAEHGPAHPTALLALSALAITPVTFLLGGTQPALLRSVAAGAEGAAATAGAIVGANTLGSVAGVAIAIAAIPTLGLWTTLAIAAATGATVGVAALLLSLAIRPVRGLPIDGDAAAPDPALPSPADPPESGLRGERPLGLLLVLVLAAAAGGATLGYEVLSARMAGIRLGSSLFAWGAVLGLFLAGLSGGNLAFAGFAARTARPATALAWLELAAAAVLALGLAAIHPPLAAPSTGLAPAGLLAVALGVLPASFLMGGAFPLFARLAIAAGQSIDAAARSRGVAGSFGALVAWNTAGGIAGALAAPAILLPVFGLLGGAHACAGLNLAVALTLFARSEPARLPGRVGAVLGVFALAALAGGYGLRSATRPGVIVSKNGRNATAVVVSVAGRRDLVVDGDPEASTGGSARVTEQLLAALPLALHPAPRRFLEIGLGSGITLATAARSPLQDLVCVEIADAVIAVAPFFEPDNRAVLRDTRLRLVHRDARVFLRSLDPDEARFDVIAANTLHPWALGATGLYSREYFERLAAALASGGLAAQWLPVDRIDASSFDAILRTFFEVFEHGSLLLGEGNVLLLGAREPIPRPERGAFAERIMASGLDPERLGLALPGGLDARTIASARVVRERLTEAPILHDDRPLLEAASLRSPADRDAMLFERLAALAGARSASGSGAQAGLQLWLEAEAARAAGDIARADAREALAERAGFGIAARARAARLAAKANRAFDARSHDRARQLYASALEIDPGSTQAALGLGVVSLAAGEPARAEAFLRSVVEREPWRAAAWNELASALQLQGRAEQAARAVARALEANPFYAEALANAALLALEAGEPSRAEDFAKRLRALGSSPMLDAVEQALRTRR